MGCCQSADDIEKTKPLLGNKSSKEDNNNNPSIIGSAAVQSTTKPDVKDVKNPIDEDSKDEPMIEKTSILPGELVLDLSFDLDKDLELLREKYPTKYKSLFDRKMIPVESKNIKSNETNSLKI